MDKGLFFEFLYRKVLLKNRLNHDKDTEESDLSDLVEENKKLWDYVEELEKELEDLASIYANDLTYISRRLKVEETRRERDEILRTVANLDNSNFITKGAIKSLSACVKNCTRGKNFCVFVLLRDKFYKDYPINHDQTPQF